jgi:hypothetical protein
MVDPNTWREVEPEHVAEIDTAIEHLLGLIGGLSNKMVVASACLYVIEKIDEFMGMGRDTNPN